MTDRVKAANDALATKVAAAFPTATFRRNPDATFSWGKDEVCVAFFDDEDPEILRAFVGAGGFDLKLSPRVVVARRKERSDRLTDQAADFTALAAALAADRKLGGAVEWADLESRTTAELDTDKWFGGGLELGVRLLFWAPTKVG